MESSAADAGMSFALASARRRACGRDGSGAACEIAAERVTAPHRDGPKAFWIAQRAQDGFVLDRRHRADAATLHGGADQGLPSSLMPNFRLPCPAALKPSAHDRRTCEDDTATA